ncbi:MAG: class I SAM-dependent methyltransferase [Flavobacterium sp.]|nr:MAG: class I SAM-dependent methyltransferase [Flavobacterium sp.]
MNYTRKIQSKISHGSVLEIGCGNGYLLKTLSDGGFDCYGIEPSPLAYNHAKNVLKLNVDNCFLHESKFYDQQFDVIVMIDVVEHISEMNLFMQQITKVLKPGGFIFIGTGDINSLNARIGGANWGYFYTWEHVSFFNRASIKLLLEKFKFTEIEVRKTSLKHKPVENLIEFGKNIVKKVVNPFLKKKYYHGICFDHLIVMAKYNG